MRFDDPLGAKAIFIYPKIYFPFTGSIQQTTVTQPVEIPRLLRSPKVRRSVRRFALQNHLSPFLNYTSCHKNNLEPTEDRRSITVPKKMDEL